MKVSVKIILFGSCAKGIDTRLSDIDLLILTAQKEKVGQYLRKKRFYRAIQPVIVTADELMQMKERDSAFYQEIMMGIVLWGVV
ncbi:MAG: nucleotidyltransferase domain-containing protein [Candidatus Thermoplasmatota archaeon]|nr:nucleotidyltransferase domain-containing protein [Candidatus Thermoplasmatota archaeon]MBU1940326.1 nucleotidyltransferase domain-containing protein [Candidatus Thermoplasmatota archaeon]